MRPPSKSRTQRCPRDLIPTSGQWPLRTLGELWFGGMGDSMPDVTFPYVARAIARFGLAYLHIIEPRVTGNVSDDDKPPVAAGLLRPLFGGPVIAAGGFNAAGAEAILAKGEADLVAFGRHFLANIFPRCAVAILLSFFICFA